MTAVNVLSLLAAALLCAGLVLRQLRGTAREQKRKTTVRLPSCPGRKTVACLCPGCPPGAAPGLECACAACKGVPALTPAQQRLLAALQGSPAGRTAPKPAALAAPAARKRSGVEGFDGAFEFAAGSVRGLRQWTLPLGDFEAIMAGSAPEVKALTFSGSLPLLRGVTGMSWRPGIMKAVCNNYPGYHKPPVEYDPRDDGVCGCGFWAYWGVEEYQWHNRYQVYGIVEGTGRVVIGTKGFRAEQARIIALVPAFTIEASAPSAELAQARQRADAWMAVIMDLLGCMYPDARVFATLKGMLACVPTGEVTQ